MYKRFPIRSTALAVVWALLFAQAGWALDLSGAVKSSFVQEPEETLPPGVTPQSLQSAEAQKLDLISQKQALESLVAGSVSVEETQDSPEQSDEMSAAAFGAFTEDEILPDSTVVAGDFFDDIHIVGTFSPTNDPYYGNLDWLQQVNGDDAWEFTRGAGITIAVLDTGIDLDHPDLSGNYWVNTVEATGLPSVDDDGNGFVDDIRGWDFVGNDNLPSDQNGHGTHVAGIIAARRNNNIGIAGMAPESKIIPVQVLNEDGGGFWPDVLNSIIEGIQYAADLGADVINLSFAIPYDLFTAVQKNDFMAAIDYARARNSIVVAAAGNGSLNINAFYPADFTNVITVGSVDWSNLVSSFSNFGSGLDLVAPGENVLSTFHLNNSYEYGTGTSMSTAIVSGAVAQILSLNPMASFDDILRVFTYSSADKGDPGLDPYYGLGVLDTLKAVTYDYFDGGYLKMQRHTDGSVDHFYNDNFYGNKIGRIWKTVEPDGTYRTFDEYWPGSATVKTENFYNVDGTLWATNQYDSSGNPISDTVAVSSRNAQRHTFTDAVPQYLSGGVLSISNNALINYALNIPDDSAYSLRLSTAQLNPAGAPSGYLFNIEISVDDTLLTVVDLSAEATFNLSGFIYLGSLAPGAHTLSLRWINGSIVSAPYDADLALKNIQLYKVPAQPLPACEYTSCTYDSLSRVIRSDLSDGSYILHEYYPGTVLPRRLVYYTASDMLTKIVEIYQSGNEKLLTNADGSGYVRYDEDFYGDKTGRLLMRRFGPGNFINYEEYWPGTDIVKLEQTSNGTVNEYYSNGLKSKQTLPDGSYTTYEDYYTGSNIARFQKDYSAAGVLLETREYDSSGNLIVPPPPADGEPVLVESISAHSYSSASGSVLLNASGVLGMYSNRSIDYALNIAEGSDYSLKFSTAQITSKNVPPGYLFHFNIKIDGVTVATADLNSSKTFVVSDFIDLGSLSAGAHTLTIQWTNDTNISPYDANLGIKDVEVYKAASGTPPPPPACDGASCLYDAQGRITRTNFADGFYYLHEYYGNTVQRSKTTSYSPANVLLQTEEFYESGNKKSFQAGTLHYTRYDEDFFGNKTGRLLRRFQADGSYQSFDEYWPGTATVKTETVYSSAGVLLATNNYDQNGNLIPPPPTDGEPVLVESISAQNYSSASGSVLLNAGGVLGMYSNRSIDYALNIAEGSDYSLKFSTAQITSKNVPPGYLFHFNIKIDGVTIATADLNSSKTFVVSDFIDLGSLSAGAHTLTIQWTNDTNAAPYDTNLGIKDIEVYKTGSGTPPSLPCDAVTCQYDAQNRIIRSNFSNENYAIHEYYGTTEQRSKSTYYTSINTITHTVEFYQSGNEKSNISQDASGYTRYDENFYGNNTGRLLTINQANGSYQSFDEYWPGTATVKTERLYDALGVLIETKNYDQNGNLIPPPPAGGDPVLVSSINAQNYTSTSGTIYNYSDGVLAMYGNRTVNYALDITENSDYSLKFSAGQITSKNAPPGYLFHVNIQVDGVTVATLDLSSSKTFTVTDFIDLGSLSVGAHTLSIQWTNATAPTGYDANFGFKDLEVYQVP